MMSQSAGDTRKPLPLPAMMAEHQKQNMREHLAAVQAIIAAIGRDDMDLSSPEIERSPIGYETRGHLAPQIRVNVEDDEDWDFENPEHDAEIVERSR